MQAIIRIVEAVFYIVLGTIVALIGMITGGDNPPDEIETDNEHQRKI